MKSMKEMEKDINLLQSVVDGTVGTASKLTTTVDTMIQSVSHQLGESYNDATGKYKWEDNKVEIEKLKAENQELDSKVQSLSEKQHEFEDIITAQNKQLDMMADLIHDQAEMIKELRKNLDNLEKYGASRYVPNINHTADPSRPLTTPIGPYYLDDDGSKWYHDNAWMKVTSGTTSGDKSK